MPQQEQASGLDVDPDTSHPLPSPSSPPPPPAPAQQQQHHQLSPETLRELVLACGREEEASTSTSSSAAARDCLRGQLGFCFDPMPWERAAAAIADGGVAAMGRMGRMPEGVARYWRWRDEVCAREYASTADYVRIEIMGCEVAAAGGELKREGEKSRGGGGSEEEEVVFFSLSFFLSSFRKATQLSRIPLPFLLFLLLLILSR